MKKFFKWLGISLAVLMVVASVWGYYYIYKPFIFIDAALNNDLNKLYWLHKEKSYSANTKIFNGNAITFILLDEEKEPEIKTIEFLLKGGAEVEAKSFRGLTNLHYAIMRKWPDIVKLLLQYGANVNSLINEKR